MKRKTLWRYISFPFVRKKNQVRRAEIGGSGSTREIRGGDGQSAKHFAAQSEEGEELREIGEVTESDADEPPAAPERDHAELGAETYECSTGQQRFLRQLQSDQLA